MQEVNTELLFTTPCTRLHLMAVAGDGIKKAEASWPSV